MPQTPPHLPEETGLVVEGLARRFGSSWALARVSLRVAPGESLLLMGPNGSGKTTLLRCLATALQADHGELTFDGQPMWAQRHALRSQIALLSHATRLYDDLSARQNLDAWRRIGKYDADIDQLLHRVGLSDAGSKPVRAFSAGMRRRLALARALIKRPRLVLFDEPFSALDPAGRELVAGVIREVQQAGATLLLSTHHTQLGARFCDRALLLEAGQVRWRGPATEAVAAVSA